MAPLRRLTRSEVAERSSKRDVVCVIDNLVYDVTRFLEDHPGGHEVLLEVGGGDASQAFRDVGHSREARQQMHDYLVGELVDEDKTVAKTKHAASVTRNDKEKSFLLSWQFSLAAALVLTAIHTYLFGLYSAK